MKTLCALIFVVLISAGSCVPRRRASPELLQQADEAENRIKGMLQGKPTFTEYISVITNMLETKAPVDNIKTLFETLIGEVNSQQLRHDELSYAQQSECTEELSFRRKEVSTATTSLNKAVESKGRCEISLTKAESHLAINLQIQQKKDGEISSLNEIREQQKALYEQRKLDYKGAIDIVDAAIPLVQELGASANSFVEMETESTVKRVGAHSIEMVMQLISLVRSDLTDTIAVQLNSMLAAPSNIKASDVARMTELLSNLRKSIENSFERYTKEENDAVATHQIQIEEIQAVIADLQNQEGNLKTIIGEMTSCIGDENAIIAAASIKKRRNAELLANADEMCKSVSAEYEEATKNRKEAIQLYKKIVEWLQEYFRNRKSE
eukprot:TRINITY_DN0_c1263_g1_i1.p1 TRINITY_DN0_c1263_g1~~TRINITY_DN0_c1263_g1_i1.p1  ORF type:complete len:381 (+),score=125.41 TRINITY_DN0_c1263_g1_i1:39-1181(+)